MISLVLNGGNKTSNVTNMQDDVIGINECINLWCMVLLVDTDREGEIGMNCEGWLLICFIYWEGVLLLKNKRWLHLVYV